MRRLIGWAALAGLSIATASVARAGVMVSDFDVGGTYYGGTEGWFPYGAPGLGTAPSPAGGSDAMYITMNQYGNVSVTAQNWAVPDVGVSAIVGNSQLEFDLIVPGTGANAWLPTGSSTIEVEIQLLGGASGTVNHIATLPFSGALKDSAVHMVYDYSGETMDPTATGWNISLKPSGPGYDWGWDGANASSIPFAARVYVDNIQLSSVPEPAALGLLSLPAASLALRRRRRGQS